MATAKTKMMVSAASRMFSAISLGVLPVGALDEGDHPVHEALAGFLSDLDDDAVREHGGAAGHCGAVAAGLANHRGRFAGDGRFVHRRNAFHHIAVAGNDLTRGDDHEVALLQQRRGDLFQHFRGAGAPADEAVCDGVGFGLAQGVGLRLAASLGDGFGDVREKHCQPEPEHGEPAEPAALADGEHRRPDGADLDDEHHRVAPQRAWIELADRVRQRLEQQCRVQQPALKFPAGGVRRWPVRARIRYRGHFSESLRRVARAPARAGR